LFQLKDNMSKRTLEEMQVDEMQREIARAQLGVKKAMNDVEHAERVLTATKTRARRAGVNAQELVEYAVTDPDTLKRWTFWLTRDQCAKLDAEMPKIGGTRVEKEDIIFYDDSTDTTDESLALTLRPTYATEAYIMTASFYRRWSDLISETMTKMTLPGGAVFYFTNLETARYFMSRFNSMVECAMAKAGEDRPHTLSAEIMFQKCHITAAGLGKICDELYVPGMEHNIFETMRTKADDYVRRMADKK